AVPVGPARNDLPDRPHGVHGGTRRNRPRRPNPAVRTHTRDPCRRTTGGATGRVRVYSRPPFRGYGPGSARDLPSRTRLGGLLGSRVAAGQREESGRARGGNGGEGRDGR